MSTKVPPPNSDPLFSEHTDEEYAAKFSDVSDEWIANELVAQGDGLSLAEAKKRVQVDRTKEIGRVCRGLLE